MERRSTTDAAGCAACPRGCGPGDEAGLDRRRLLLAGLSGAVVVALPACGPTVEVTARDAGSDALVEGEAGSDGEAGACESTCATASTLAVTFEKYPALAVVGGSAVVSDPAYSDPVCHNGFIVVIQPTAGEFRAFSASCTHACCQVTWQASAGEFHCPCHGSTFSSTGQVVNGPATIALPTLAACADACGVYVTLA